MAECAHLDTSHSFVPVTVVAMRPEAGHSSVISICFVLQLKEALFVAETSSFIELVHHVICTQETFPILYLDLVMNLYSAIPP